MALSGEQITFVAEITREAFSTIDGLVDSLTTDQESLLIDDIDAWEAIRNSYVKFKGDGVDFDNERKRAAIFYRVRNMLGLPFLVYDLSADVFELVELEVGSNFG